MSERENDVADTPGTEGRERVERAIHVVRREALKAAAVHAVVDAVLALLVVNLLVTLSGVDLPGPWYARYAISAVAGVVVGAVEFWWRTRDPLVEQFESVNPNVEEALRTARDAAADGEETRMARRLYADVLDGLQRASSTDLVSTRRVVGSVLLVLVLSVATVQVSVMGLSLAGLGGAGEDGPDDRPPRPDEYDGLHDGDAILGEEEDVGEGDEDLDAVIGGSAGGSEDAEDVDRSYDSGGFSSSGSYEAEQAGFSASDDVENADIIREYNIRIREDEE